MAADAHRLPISLDPLIAEAKQRMRRRRVLLAIVFALAAVATVGVASGGAAAVTGLFHPGFVSATPCPEPNYGGVWAYEAPSAPAGYGVMLVKHPLEVGDRLGRSIITAIAALPNDCKPTYVLPGSVNEPASGILSGRLILQPMP